MSLGWQLTTSARVASPGPRDGLGAAPGLPGLPGLSALAQPFVPSSARGATAMVTVDDAEKSAVYVLH